MKKIFTFVIIGLLVGLLLFASIGCATEPAAPAAQPFATTTYVDQKDATLNAAIATKADQPTVTALSTRVDGIAAQGTGNSYTKDEINTKFSNLISNLTDEQVALLKTKLGVSSTSGGTGTTISTTNDVVVSLYKDVANPVYTPGTYTWWLKVSNGYAEYKKVFIGIAFGASGTISGNIDVTVDLTGANGTYIYAPDLPVRPTETTPGGRFSMNFVPSGGLLATLIGANSQGYLIIKGNTEVVIPVTLVLDYVSGATQWSEISWSRTVLNYP